MSFPNIPQKDPGLLTLALDLAFLMVRHSPYVAGAILPEVGILVNSPRKLRRQKSVCLLDCTENSMILPDCIENSIHVLDFIENSLCVIDCIENSVCVLDLIENPIGVLDHIEKSVLSVSWMGRIGLYKTATV